jgi:hypothetical protein
VKYKIILECIIYENFDVDLDVMKYNNTIYNIIGSYDSNLQMYKACIYEFNSNVVSIFSKSLIKRCILINNIGLVVTADGTISKMNSTNTITTNIDKHVHCCEYYSPYLYLVTEHHEICIYCPFENKLLCILDCNYSSPITHLFVYPTVIKDKYRITVSLFNKQIHSFFIYKGKVVKESQLLIHVEHCFEKSFVKQIFCDECKCIIVLDNGSLSFYDSLNGNFWYTLHKFVDGNYFTRIHVSRSNFIIDGIDKLIIYNNVEDNDNEQIDDMKNFQKWITPWNENNFKSPFMEALMKTPVYNIKQIELNYSFPLNNTNSTKLI